MIHVPAGVPHQLAIPMGVIFFAHWSSLVRKVRG